MTYIKHITLQSAHSRNSVKSEISDDALQLCTDLITECLLNDGKKIPIPNFDGYSLLAGNVGGKTLLGSVWNGDTVLINFAIATKSRNAAKAWHELHKHATQPVTDSNNAPPTPFIAVSLEPTIEYYGDSLEWLGDFERCLAWAWVDYEN